MSEVKNSRSNRAAPSLMTVMSSEIRGVTAITNAAVMTTVQNRSVALRLLSRTREAMYRGTR